MKISLCMTIIHITFCYIISDYTITNEELLGHVSVYLTVFSQGPYAVLGGTTINLRSCLTDCCRCNKGICCHCCSECHWWFYWSIVYGVFLFCWFAVFLFFDFESFLTCKCKFASFICCYTIFIQYLPFYCIYVHM